jgi:hypothetical protein
MQIHVCSNKTIRVDARRTAFVEGKVIRALGRFDAALTRVAVHLSDVNARKGGPADKHCLIEMRPAGAPPLSASAAAGTVALAVTAALGKAKRALSAFFARKEWASPAPAVARAGRAKTASPKGTGKGAAKGAAKAGRKVSASKTSARDASARQSADASSRGPKKKAIFQARRKAWPAR